MKQILYKKYFALISIFCDLTILYFLLYLIVRLRFGTGFNPSIWHSHLFAFTPVIFLTLLLYFLNNLYEYSFQLKDIKFTSYFGRIQVLILILGIVYFYIMPIGLTPKTNLILFWGLSSVVLYLFHSFISSKQLINSQNILFLNNEPTTLAIHSYIQNNQKLGYNSFIFNIKDSGLDSLNQYIIQNKISLIILDSSMNISEKLYPMIFQNVNFDTFENFYETLFKKIPLELIDSNWFLKSINSDKYSLFRIFKRSFDIFGSLILLLISIPFLPLIVFLIKYKSPGPILYLSPRCGKNNKKIHLYKFRTMVANATTIGPNWTLTNDNRITKFGKYLRKYYIDEIPQCINILLGDLSFVGPRPEEINLIFNFEANIPFYNIRHLVAPGLTGWAQINLSNTHSIDESREKLKYDLYYIKNYSIWLDLYILIKTLRVPFI